MEKLEEQELSTAEDVVEIDEEILQQKDDSEKVLQETIKKIKETASEEDPRPSQQVNLRTILGGDILTAEMVRSQIWLFVLIVAFTIVYVAFRYQCQQDMQAIDRLETQLKDAKNNDLVFHDNKDGTYFIQGQNSAGKEIKSNEIQSGTTNESGKTPPQDGEQTPGNP